MPLDRERLSEELECQRTPDRIDAELIGHACKCGDGKDEAIDILCRIIVAMQRNRSVPLHHILNEAAFNKGEIFAAGIKSIIDQRR